MPAGSSHLSQLIPYNAVQFDRCMAYLAQKWARGLTRYDMVKLHVMTDVYHVLETGHQSIGGPLEPWNLGPVVARSWARLSRWERRFDQLGEEPPGYALGRSDKGYTTYRPTAAPDLDELAASELAAMDRAVELLKPMSFDESQRFFHGDKTFMGQAYNSARRNHQKQISWADIIDAYADQEGIDLTDLKRRLISYC
ncbi:MAG TPA: hypothetical protein VH370_01665 [Humisphaera sp.]|jgi:hypothetical protein|nr:hypothetical protein [Humisphaera sp.]